MENKPSFHFITIPDSKLISQEKRNLLPNGNYLNGSEQNFSVANFSNDFYLRISDAEKFFKFEDELLGLLFQKLNQIHSIDWTKKEYEILIGHWLQGFLTILIKKINTFSEIINSYKISSSTFFASSLESIIPKDFSDFANKTFDPIWNNMLDGEIWEHLFQKKFQNFKSAYVRHSEPSNLSSQINTKRSSKYYLKKIVFDFYQKLIGIFLHFAIAKQKYLVLNSYLPKKTDLKLQLKLMQLPIIFPFFIKKKSSDENKIWHHVRKHSSQINLSDSKSFEGFILNLCLRYIPKIYLEDFDELNSWAIQKAKKSKVKLIFTSNNFASDEPFKFWTINMKKLHSTKYVVGQHGNRYGVRRIFKFHEVETCDKFLTWGQISNIEKDISMFNFKTAGLKPLSPKRDGRILFTQDIFPLQFDWAGDYFSFVDYFNLQLNFMKSLPKQILESIDLRLHKGAFRSPFNETEKWRAAGFADSLSDPWENFPLLLKRYRLVIHGYDTTGLLESLNLNFPTLCFIHFPAEDLSKFHSNLYNQLIDVGIVHYSIESLKKKLIEINSFDNLSRWWYSNSVQNTVLNFCNELSKKVHNPVEVLAKTLEEISNS